MLQSLKVWLTDDGAFIGFQFVANDGQESPRWGLCTGKSSAVIYFTSVDALGSDIGASQQPAMGVEFYMDDNERSVTRHDAIVMAVQALVEDESFR